jgi:photosystem II stability/assembly factor-like uncharacterized protein
MRAASRWIAGGSLITVLVAGCGSAPSRTQNQSSTSQTGATATPTGTSSASSTETASAPAVVGPAGGRVPAGFGPASTTFVSSMLGWALGIVHCPSPPCTSIVRTRDGGLSWQGVPAPKAPLRATPSGTVPAGSVHTIRFADQANGWVAGRTLYATHDGGASWHPVSFGAANSEISSMGTAAGWVYAAAFGCTADDECLGAGAVYSAEIGSDSWTRVATIAQSNQARTDLVVTGAGWYLPISAGIEHGAGTAAPTLLPNPCKPDRGTAPAAPTVAVADAQHLDAMCVGNGAAGSASYQPYGSTDGGLHWRTAGASHWLQSGLTGLADNQAGVLLMACASGNSELYRSTDDGVSLASVLGANSGGAPWIDLGFTTAQQAVVILASAAMYLSHDSGTSWAKVSF